MEMEGVMLNTYLQATVSQNARNVKSENYIKNDNSYYIPLGYIETVDQSGRGTNPDINIGRNKSKMLLRKQWALKLPSLLKK